MQHQWLSIQQRPLVLVPTGATEQHGPHLPLDTDTTIAAAVAECLATRLLATAQEQQVLVAPALCYGASGEHQAFPGTASIGHDALRGMLIELVRSLSTWAGRIVFVNAHGGNIHALTGAMTQLSTEGHDVAWLPCAPPGADAHAGHAETSLMLHLAPHSVRMSHAVPGNTTPITELMSTVTTSGIGSVSASGVLGDPTHATAEHGAQLLEVVVADAYERIASATTDTQACLRRPATDGCP